MRQTLKALLLVALCTLTVPAAAGTIYNLESGASIEPYRRSGVVIRFDRQGRDRLYLYRLSIDSVQQVDSATLLSSLVIHLRDSTQIRVPERVIPADEVLKALFD